MVSETGRLIRAGLSRVGYVLRRRAAPGPVRSSCRRFYTILRDGRPRQAQETRYQAYEGGDQDMCRWIAYSGHTIALERYVTEPAHSLVSQSIAALESTAAINGDGFGLGWYGDHPEPGRYREVQPAWSDENLRYLCRHLHSHLFFAHVRAATGTPITRSNCHPFACGPWLFMHNGYLGDWARLRRPIEALIPDELYASRSGTTDSEAMFLALLGCGLMGSAPRRDPLTATANALAAMTDLAGGEGGVPLRFTAALSDGKDLYAFRYAANDDANSLYYQASGNGVVIVSEPLDGQRGNWIAVPENHAVVALKGSPVEVVPLDRYGLGAGISPLRKRTRMRA